MIRRSIPITAVTLIAACLCGTGLTSADDARWTVDWSTPTQAQNAERALDSIERAFGDALAASPGARQLRTTADLLITSRTEHDRLRTSETTALMRVHEGRERVDRDTRLLMDRRMTTAWASLQGQQRQNQITKEDRYLRTIRTVTRNRERFHQQARGTRERVTHALQAFSLSWGELAVERSAGNGMSLPNDIWLQHMELNARSFNEFVRQRYQGCSFVGARPTRALRAASRRATPNPIVSTPSVRTPRIGEQPVRGEPSGFPTPTTESAQPRPAPSNPWDPAPQPILQKPAPAASAPSGRVEDIGGFRWYYDFAEAAAAARAQGKLLLALATKPDCSMCEKVKKSMVPTDLGRVNRTAIGYIYDIMTCVGASPTASSDEMAVNRVVRGNLPTATLMPLVGFITPDKQWVAGFSGYPSQSEFNSVVSRAASR